MTDELRCEICSAPAAGVASSVFGPVSHAYCRECAISNREVWGTLFGVPRNDVADWARPYIEATCAFYGKTEDEFWEEMAQLDAEYAQYEPPAGDGSEEP